MASVPALLAITWLGALLRCLPEREPHAGLFEALLLVADHLDAPSVAPALMVRFELEVLAGLGFRLDLSQCAATGLREDLPFVSPKSGRAVSRAAGEPYRDRLLRLPDFLKGAGGRATPDSADVSAGLALTGHFLARDVFEPRGVGGALTARAAYVAEISKAGV